MGDEDDVYISPLNFDFYLSGLSGITARIITVGNIRLYEQYYYDLFMQHGYKAELIISGAKQAEFHHLLKFEESYRLNLDCYLNNPNIWSKADIVNGFKPYLIEYDNIYR